VGTEPDRDRPHSGTGDPATAVSGDEAVHARPRSDADLIEHVLRSLMVAARMLLLYPSGHNRITRKFTEIESDLAELFAQRSRPLELTVAGHHLIVGNAKFDQFSEVGERFALQLRHRQIRSVAIRAGAEVDEIRLLVEILRIDHRALLRVGGTQVFLDQCPHPHIHFVLFEGGGTPSLHGVSAASPHDGRPPDEDDTGAPDTPPPGATEAPSEEDPYAVRQADVLEDALTSGSDQERFEQQLEEFALKEILDGQTPDEEAVAFTLDKDLLANDAVRICMEEDAREVRERFRKHSAEETALRILFRLLSEAGDETQYRQRRRMLLQAVRDPRFFTGELVLVIRRLMEDEGNWAFERGEQLAQTVIAYVNDAAAVTQLLASIPLVPEVARGVLTALAAREDAMPLLGRLVTSQLPKVVAEDVPRTFVQVAEADPKRFAQWALTDRKTLLRPSVIRVLLEQAPALLSPVIERLLLERPDRDRRKLLHLLAGSGHDEALHLLVCGVRACGRGVAIEALQTLGRFPHPISVQALREVVDRNNNDEVDVEESEAAIYSLYEIGLKDAHAFLWEIVQSRRSLFSYAYVRPLRLLAENALQGTSSL